jgi:hypothetical protein
VVPLPNQSWLRPPGVTSHTKLVGPATWADASRASIGVSSVRLPGERAHRRGILGESEGDPIQLWYPSR